MIFMEADHTYSLAFDKDENVWFTNPGTGQIGKVDAKTLKVKQWMPPTTESYERRIAIDADGTVWFGEFQKGKIGRFDPKTETFKEYDVPGGIDSFPYAIGIAARSQRLVFVVLSGCGRPPGSEDGENCGVSVSAFGEHDSRILSGLRRKADVVRVALEQ